MNKSITSLQNPYVKHLVHLRQNSDYRYEHKSVVVEGVKVVQEIAAFHQIKALAVCDPALIPRGISVQDIFLVDEKVMRKVSGMQQPEGIVAEIAMPPFSTLSKASYIVALDHVSDPGNVGAILRTALALGWDGAFLIGEGCDPYNEKAIRAARGATFRIPMRRGSWEQFYDLASRMGEKPFVADLQGMPFEQCPKRAKCLLVLGNEAHGPSQAAFKLCQSIVIPMQGPMESLNVSVAGGILLYNLRH